MIWDLENIFFLMVVLLALVLCLWARYYGPKGRSFIVLVLLFAVSLLCAFEILAGLVAPSEIRGQVSQVNLQSAGKYDSSKFEVTSPSGLRVRISSKHNLVALLTVGESLDVSYSRWTSRPYRIERLEGSQRQLLLAAPQHSAIAWIFLLLAVALGASNLRRFRLGAPS